MLLQYLHVPLYSQHLPVGFQYQYINGSLFSLLQATLPECCPYPMNGPEEAEKPREELVRIFNFVVHYFLFIFDKLSDILGNPVSCP